MKIRVIEVGQRLSPKFLRKFRVLLNQIAESENADAEIDCILTTDRYVQKLNRKYLGKDKPTDVLSFPLGDVWEIYISVDTARKKAFEYGFDTEYEIFRYGVHGLLHLLGYDHNDAHMAEEMDKVEEKYLTLWCQYRY
ncbi:MAG TPA: rRNA maturation RNase YbeY [Candidatus Hydrothermia bacterium]|nr:rRNA maturation RNase YbeY [Candidatus Hydrothermae bacterium]MDD3649146.1 rRNA maturation RNase YbeY [Candidatus Hydrothermia bacterium]MDD5572185.1 rRNA maturation RNase YbeY [Candidatus Hydrothermia bacterium]HOK23086.1 rRNA maturation RNase YbeY [Candidatus Hydrothermia bacterium]HOL23654.1 rRNA maturation RNase YbeY [Candidatus Hydrothermia bacterium]